MSALNHRYEFVLLFDVQDGNPNGDPDAGNLPRADPETGHGLVTDVCLKRKVRNYVALKHGEQPPYDVYVREGAILNVVHEKAYKSTGVEKLPKARTDKQAAAKTALEFLCKNFYDIRSFGAVMSTGDMPVGNVRGPVQLAFARSVDPIVALEHCITRVAITKEEDADKKEHEMGRKYTVPYGLYRAHGFVSAHLAQQTGFSEGDRDLLWESLTNMFEHDRSAARGQMASRALFVFEHDSALGNAPAHKLFDRIQVSRKDATKPARAFEDYAIQVDEEGLGQVCLQRVL